MDLIDYRIFHPKSAEYTFFSGAHGIFSRIDHMLGHKTSLNKFRNDIKHLFWLQHYETRNQLQEKKNTKNQKHMEAKQYATKQPMGHWRNQEEIKKYLETNENKNTYDPISMGCSKSRFKREVYSNTSLPQETNKQLKVSRRKQIIRIRVKKLQKTQTCGG